MKKLTVQQQHNPEWDNFSNPDDPNRFVYQVKRITNSRTPEIRKELNPEELDYYCTSEEWEVVIT